MVDDEGWIVYATDHTGRYFDRYRDPNKWHWVPSYQEHLESELFNILQTEINREFIKEFIK